MKHLYIKMPDDFNLFLFGDDQYGSEFHCEGGVDKMLNLFDSEYAGCNVNFGWHHGDAVEGIAVNDYRFSRDQNKIDVIDEQVDHVIEKYRCMGKRLFGINEGNHERKLSKQTNVTNRIAKGLGIENGTWSTIITYLTKDEKIMFRHHATHGYKGINSSLDDERERRFAMERSLRRLLMRKSEDCLLNSMGHTHKLLTVRPINRLMLMTDDKTREFKAYHTKDLNHGRLILGDQRWFCNTGSFLRLYAEGLVGYAEIAGYDPIDKGFLVARIRDRKIVGVDEIVVD